MAFDYSQLYDEKHELDNSWESIYYHSDSLAFNLIELLQKTVFLPQDFYDVVAAYYLLPSALCKTVPYLFLCGQSGSGKSILATVASYLHGIDISSSSDSFAGIRNTLQNRRYGWVEVEREDVTGGVFNKCVEKNTFMVWDDIDASVFTTSPDLYRMFKYGYARDSDKISVSGKETGTLLEFHCFCPKVFSSISSLHLDDRFKELKRRLIVIPCKRIEELSDERLNELGVTKASWQDKLIDIYSYDWRGFSEVFDNYWDIGRAKDFLDARRELSKTAKGLTSQTRAISLDLMACGIASEIWSDRDEAITRMKFYWDWFKRETERTAGLSQLLKEYIKTEQKNANNGNRELVISVTEIRQQIELWFNSGWILDKPRTSTLKDLMADLGLRLHKGFWRKN